MVKKLEVWLNNKLSKCLHCTLVIKFYRIFVTELVFTFFVFKYQNHFEFPKDGKWSPHLKILEIPGGRGGGGVIKDPLEWKILGCGWVQIKTSSVGEVWIFSGTTQYKKTSMVTLFPLSAPISPLFYHFSLELTACGSEERRTHGHILILSLV